MRANDFRRMALGRAGAVEGAHVGHPDFRVNNRIFATLHHDPEFGMVSLTAGPHTIGWAIKETLSVVTGSP